MSDNKHTWYNTVGKHLKNIDKRVQINFLKNSITNACSELAGSYPSYGLYQHRLKIMD